MWSTLPNRPEELPSATWSVNPGKLISLTGVWSVSVYYCVTVLQYDHIVILCTCTNSWWHYSLNLVRTMTANVLGGLASIPWYYGRLT